MQAGQYHLHIAKVDAMKNAASMLVVKDGLILSISRRNDKTKFGLPGGKQEDGESIEEAAIRECNEETSIIVTKCFPIFTREELKKKPEELDFLCHCFCAEEWNGDPKDSGEGVVKWLTAADLTGENGAFPNYNKKTIDVFKEKYPNIKLIGE